MVCLQIHNDYLVPGGETKSAILIADLLESHGIKIIRYYKSNTEIKKGIIYRINCGIKSIYNRSTVRSIQKIIDNNKIDFALVHNISPIISNSVYSVLNKNRIKIYKYLQNYNLLCLNGAMNKGSLCDTCRLNQTIGIKKRCYKNSVIYTTFKYFSQMLLWKCYLSKIDRFIAISEYVKTKHIKYGIPEEKIFVLYHFCNDAFNEIHMKKTQKYIMYIGRISSEKGIFTLLEAMKQLNDVNLKIMGTGELETAIKEYIEKNKLINVELIGYKDGEEKNKIIRESTAIIIPSEWEEPFGRIVIEAYQAGTPVIASSVGGLKELVVDGVTGYTFEKGNAAELIQRIRQICSVSDEAIKGMRISCSLFAKQKFSRQAYYDNFIKMINEDKNETVGIDGGV